MTAAEEPSYIYDSEDDDMSEKADDSEDKADDEGRPVQSTGPSLSVTNPSVQADSLGDSVSIGSAAELKQPATKSAEVDGDKAILAHRPSQSLSTAATDQLDGAGIPAEKTTATGSLVVMLRDRMTKLSRHMSQKLQISAPSLGLQQAKQFTQRSIARAASTDVKALPALAHSLHEKLAQTQIELAEIREYRAAAEHRQKLAAAAASMAAFTEDRLQVN